MYIQKIEIKNLWGNDFPWTLNEDINVLIGKNGSGKSTILRMLFEAISPVEDSQLNYRLFDPIDEIIIELTNDIVIRVNSESRSITGNVETTLYPLNTTLINTFDVVEKSATPNTTLLDEQLKKLKLEFVTYQRDLSNRVEDAFKNDDNKNHSHEKIQAIYDTKNLCLEILAELFRHTDKTFDEKGFHFFKTGFQTPILPENLSSGEKQILIILLTTLLSDRKEYILLMDEPEISLHIDWQRTLIKNIRQINPNCQIIIATHSPTVYYQGWTEKVTRIEELKSTLTESTIRQQKTIPGRMLRLKDDLTHNKGNGRAQLYQFNRKINAYTSLTKDECIELLDFLKTNGISPDVITFTTLISKLNRYFDAKEIFDLMIAETYTQLSQVKPHEITLNTLIQKVNRVEQGIELIQEVCSNDKLQLYPDIRTFSTLIGKVKNTDEMRVLEEMRNYYGIKTNEIYLNKLKFKR
jgi:ABC-type multidrug transport system ATPase subunit